MLRHHDLTEHRLTASVEDDVMHRLETELVVAAIAALPAEQRSVLIMRDVQGNPERMVANALGLSTVAMKSRLHRSRRHGACRTSQRS